MKNEAIERLYKEIVKRLLIELEKVAEARARNEIESGEKGEWDFVDSLAVGSFLEQCSIAARHWELVGIATTLKQEILEMYKMDHSYLQDQEPKESEWVLEYSLADLFGMDQYWPWRLLQELGYVECKAGSGRWVPTDKASDLYRVDKPFAGQDGRRDWKREIVDRVKEEISPLTLKNIAMRMEMEDRQKARQAAKRRWEENELVTSQEAGERLETPLKAVDLHILLQKMGYLVKERGGWVATEKAAEMTYQEGIRSGIPRVLWRKEFFERLAKEIAIVREDGQKIEGQAIGTLCQHSVGH